MGGWGGGLDARLIAERGGWGLGAPHTEPPTTPPGTLLCRCWLDVAQGSRGCPMGQMLHGHRACPSAPGASTPKRARSLRPPPVFARPLGIVHTIPAAWARSGPRAEPAPPASRAACTFRPRPATVSAVIADIAKNRIPWRRHRIRLRLLLISRAVSDDTHGLLMTASSKHPYLGDG